MGTIYIACPSRVVTGGPMLAHQMCRTLLDAGYDSKMYYYGQTSVFTTWEEYKDSPYAKYEVDQAVGFFEVNDPDSIVLLPETAAVLETYLPEAKVNMWWMSVDGHTYALERGLTLLEDDIRFFNKPETRHFVQSQYAYDYLTNDMHVDPEKIRWLTDYIDEKYMQPPTGATRENIVYYNKGKVGKVLPVIMEKHPEIHWEPISGMTIDQIVEAFDRGKVYVDFGTHMGKDRMPREAAARGLCVITNRIGSAKNDVDVPINAEYKFEDPLASEDTIIDLINDCFESYETREKDFASYREWIRGEKERFIEEAKVAAEILLKN